MLQLYLVLFSLNLVSSGLLFFIEDFRCAETIPGTILVEFVFFGHVLFLSRSSGVLQLYLVLFWFAAWLYAALSCRYRAYNTYMYS